MLNQKSKIKNLAAFSIMEVIVGLVITAIIIGLLFILFSIISNQLMIYKRDNQFVTDMNRLSYSLNKDLFENESIKKNENQLVFFQSKGDTVLFNFENKYILRESKTFIDTFYVDLTTIAYDSIKSNSKTFEKIEININNSNNPINLKFYKQIYPNQLINKRY